MLGNKNIHTFCQYILFCGRCIFFLPAMGHFCDSEGVRFCLSESKVRFDPNSLISIRASFSSSSLAPSYAIIAPPPPPPPPPRWARRAVVTHDSEFVSACAIGIPCNLCVLYGRKETLSLWHLSLWLHVHTLSESLWHLTYRDSLCMVTVCAHTQSTHNVISHQKTLFPSMWSHRKILERRRCDCRVYVISNKETLSLWSL